MAGGRGLHRERLQLAMLVCLQIVVCCVSLVCIAKIYPEYHIFYRPDGLVGGVAVMAAFALVTVLFAYSEFSFGYFVGFYFYTMIAGYLWMNFFSKFEYNHRLSGLSAAASALAFLMPALFIRTPVRQVWTPSSTAFARFLDVVLLFAAATIAVGATYNFRLVALDNIYDFRDTMTSPKILNYLIGIVSSALLPFAFACFVERKDLWRAGAVLILLLLIYPITLSKLAFFTPAWLVFMLIFSNLFEMRLAVILSLLVPSVVGAVLFFLFEANWLPYRAMIPYFGLVNFRMIAIPSMAMDYYNDFFSRNDLTLFCQIQLVKSLVSCPYHEPLAIVIYKAFGIGGNMNASLFATEGIASVGPVFAPVAVFACGLLIATANRLSAGLPARFVLISGAIFSNILLNVPLTITLLTNGAAVLFLLWYVTPRTLFEQETSQPNGSMLVGRRPKGI